MLEVEDVEDVAWTVDDMEATDRLRTLPVVQRGWCEGRVEREFRVQIDGTLPIQTQGYYSATVVLYCITIVSP
jgi:hypothetical protein